ncbi:uncharacterized protein LOC116000185 [Ipomoea triloba]|uniref:uncharacterized protein LOC116000185 n=1 Tax=Ipomoea triloba TaxID=35885 RepID=UPI00125E75A2|nr:uncharacterized protein LOC116000185 [Ipomoea triloba]
MDISFSPCNSTAHFHESSSSFGLPDYPCKQHKNHGDARGGTMKKKSSSSSSSSSGRAAKLSTDRQSVAARERRHRISDRFKILQSLVPGGSKMDTVSMLEGAIHYVNFLKAQIRLHETIIDSVSGDHNYHNYVPNNHNGFLVGTSGDCYYYDDPSGGYSQFLGDATAAIHEDEWLQAHAAVAPPCPPSQLAFVEGGAPFQAEETMYYDESMYY